MGHLCFHPLPLKSPTFIQPRKSNNLYMSITAINVALQNAPREVHKRTLWSLPVTHSTLKKKTTCQVLYEVPTLSYTWDSWCVWTASHVYTTVCCQDDIVLCLLLALPLGMTAATVHQIQSINPRNWLIASPRSSPFGLQRVETVIWQKNLPSNIYTQRQTINYNSILLDSKMVQK